MLRAVATDGHRLASVEAPLPAGAENIPGVIVPRKAIAELRKLIDESSDEINKGVNMLFGLIVGGILGGVTYVGVEKIFGDKIGETPKKIIIWVGVIVGFSTAKVFFQ